MNPVACDLDRDDWRFRFDRTALGVPHVKRFARRSILAATPSPSSPPFNGADGWAHGGTSILDRQASAMVPFKGDGSVEDHDDHRCRGRSWSELTGAPPRLDADLDVLEPPALRAAFAALARWASATATKARRRTTKPR